MEFTPELNSSRVPHLDAGPLPALAAQVACLQQLVAELLVKNERLRQELAAQARTEPGELR